MRIQRLRATHLRCFDAIDLTPGTRLNYLIGPNGAGKTTILEAIYLLSHGRSFRGGTLDVLAQRGQTGFSVHAQVVSESGTSNELGVSRGPDGWCLHVNGLDQPTLASVLERCAAICFEPGSFTLVAGGAEHRRRFLDWGVFHVERGSLEAWRKWRRALRQRSALLRADGSPEQFRIWESELERFAIPLEAARRNYFQALCPHLQIISERLLPELGPPRLHYQPGWNVERPLSQLLAEQRQQDRYQGRTRSGPHRADWRIGFQQAPTRDYLSRGQIKLVALACILAQGSLLAARSGEWPILCLDDPASELDPTRQEVVFEELSNHPMQAWITATRTMDLPSLSSAVSFHVEQQAIREVEPPPQMV